MMNHVELEVSVSLKSIEMPTGKPLLNKYESGIGRKSVWNYKAAVGMLMYIQGSIHPEISISVHQCAVFAIISVLCTNTPSDSLESTYHKRLYIWIHHMEITCYPHAT